MKRIGGQEPVKISKQYLIDLHQWRSVVALLASLIAVGFAVYGVTGGIIKYAVGPYRVTRLFRYFTINANILTAIGAAMILPFAVEGIRHKHFVCPKWAGMIFYAGIHCTTLTMLFAVLFISRFDKVLAFGGYNLFLHIVCPVMVLIAFLLIEANVRFTRKDAWISLIPFAVYAVFYVYNAIIIGEENGGWRDSYHITKSGLPTPLTIILMIVLAVAIAFLLRWAYNRVADRRLKKLKRSWDKDLMPAEIKVEILGLGRYMGMYEDESYHILPTDIIDLLAQEYGMSTEELTKVYFKGLTMSREEKAQAASPAKD